MAMKKKMSKEELRKAMSEAKKKHSAIKKVESPLARYNELDQLVCIICKTVIRSEAVWPVHLNSRQHKENILLAKQNKLEIVVATPQTNNKRAAVFKEPQDPKRVKGILKNVAQPPLNVKTSLPANFFKNVTVVNSNTVAAKVSKINVSNGGIEITKKVENVVEEKDIKEGQSTLPEGFFDDPVMDAKARNVEYKDPGEEEWERFQKEIKEETAQSAQIIGDDQEEAATERQLDVIDEQIRNWSRVMSLVKQKELVQTADKKQDNNDSSSDEGDFDETLDWRSKNSYHE